MTERQKGGESKTWRDLKKGAERKMERGKGV